MRNKKYLAAFVGIALAIGLTGCATNSQAAPLTVVVHDSVVITDAQLAEFKKETGIEVKLVKAGDAGAMTNKLILTKDQPIGDMFYGIDNTFIGAAAEAKILGEYSAIDFGDVCFNYDKTWFTNHEQAAPESIDDLTKPEFKGLTVVENPSPGDVVAVAYEDPNSGLGRRKIGLAVSRTSGHLFEDRLAASGGISNARDPHVIVRGRAVVVGWSETATGSDPIFRLRRARVER